MTLFAALASCSLLGLQHGIDWDHVAAISDVTSGRQAPAMPPVAGFFTP